ncbi:MAG: LSU ribosomal protein L10p (P0) [Candidatus Bipolaricaulis sibiricus]|uniref:Large ribosomal subunit protein uL10 n=1 Tax=Bipolaricaulis sibiricus TaxID=2501609 RepID=A0A410FVV5_BIPS1|nr:MAG: LSU ribosomal protein L10p (P0) [Candidatus Bipolaricaulis sibiricus]
MPRQDKVVAVEDLRGKLSRARSVVILDYRGLSGSDITALRRFVRKQGVELRVVKNTLTRIAATEAGLEGFPPTLTGTNALLLGEGDPAVPFRVARECARRYPQVKVKAGVFDSVAVSATEADWYATLPTREELLGRLAGALAGPIRGLAVTLSGVTRKFAVALSEVQKKKEAEG